MIQEQKCLDKKWFPEPTKTEKFAFLRRQRLFKTFFFQKTSPNRNVVVVVVVDVSLPNWIPFLVTTHSQYKGRWNCWKIFQKKILDRLRDFCCLLARLEHERCLSRRRKVIELSLLLQDCHQNHFLKIRRYLLLLSLSLSLSLCLLLCFKKLASLSWQKKRFWKLGLFSNYESKLGRKFFILVLPPTTFI